MNNIYYHGKFEGVYTFQGFSNGIDYWADSEGEHAIWYKTYGTPYSYWNIERLDYLGTSYAGIYGSRNILDNKCPNNEGDLWSWYYSDGYSWIATNDVNIKCAIEDDFCTSDNPCGIDQGDCDTHNECQDGFFCGSNNCPDSLGFHSEFDCCYAPTVGDEHFCTTADPCGQDEGDCDSNNECQSDLFCDATISCPAYLGFVSDLNCCSSGSGCTSYRIMLT